MKMDKGFSIDLDNLAAEDPRCEALAESLLARKVGNHIAEPGWTAQFMAEGDKVGAKTPPQE